MLLFTLLLHLFLSPGHTLFGVAWLSRFVSLASMAAATALAAAAWLLPASRGAAVGATVAAGLVLWRHRDNMVRLRSGAEPRIGERAREAR